MYYYFQTKQYTRTCKSKLISSSECQLYSDPKCAFKMQLMNAFYAIRYLVTAILNIFHKFLFLSRIVEVVNVNFTHSYTIRAPLVRCYLLDKINSKLFYRRIKDSLPVEWWKGLGIWFLLKIPTESAVI